MSQDLRRERDGVQYETIAGATQYIAELEAENARLRSNARRAAHILDLHAEMLAGLVMDTPDEQGLTDALMARTRAAAGKFRAAFDV